MLFFGTRDFFPATRDPRPAPIRRTRCRVKFKAYCYLKHPGHNTGFIYNVLTKIPWLLLAEGDSIDWTPKEDTTVTGIERHGVDITWKADLKHFLSPIPQWSFVKVYRNGNQMIKYPSVAQGNSTYVYLAFRNKAPQPKLNAVQNGTNVTIVFTLANLTTNDNNTRYKVLLTHDQDSETIPYFTTLIIQSEYYAVSNHIAKLKHVLKTHWIRLD